ncbi:MULTISPECIES: succinyl-diaminopimelate desuccinylase [unclassified Rathayibacter]|uniref:succinyl-diaminopimelate desuccinylase n=1 Tax=unclassified Rathayibacter TaxID=2609250 RepID=UPI00188B0394|nr:MULTISPECIES: succinyl-diaminopimelate desuccinylase [unclassified Rathayibacter]MBF4463489.1 succinyl-diaminopimelate desuccinylase [Rathayibacter sp. VKM Ac-2879]MBF4504789.1 succinyl-diaminopimelate desuccinylase [Rathayibacter sp. VKM Ac-2878]
MLAPTDVTALDLRSDPVALTRVLCDIPSVSGDERALADAVEFALSSYPHLEVLRDGDTVVARTNLGRAKRVVIAGHLDTVPINDNLPVRSTVVEGVEYLVGRGTVDMKAGVAVQLVLAAELSTPAVDITWMWYDNEEVASELNGLARLARHRPELFSADFAVLGEPTGGAVEGGCNGTLRVDVITHGVRAHSARSWVGENAIHAAAPILQRLAAYEPREVEVEGLVYREGVNAVRISGGVAGNVIPDLCTVHVNYRFAPSRSGEEAVGHLRELFAGFEVEVVDLAEGARPGLDAPLALDFLDALGVEAKPKYGWTDVARFSALGVPAVNYGPGDPLRAHADDERVAIDEITACAERLRRWLNGSS